MKWDGTNIEEIKNFAGDKVEFITDASLDDETIMITTPILEGAYASVGDFIIEDIKGELYPCKPDIFEKTYEGQIEAGDTEGFYKGIRKIFRIKGKSYDETDII